LATSCRVSRPRPPRDSSSASAEPRQEHIDHV
jgi:hypothetical protein